MICIFLDVYEEKNQCTATETNDWKVDEEALKKYCKTEEFECCPRYRAFMELQFKKATIKINK
jgi:hypothetical protein